MFICLDCGNIFDEPKHYEEDRTPGCGFEGGSFIEHYKGCPECGGAYEETIECDNCNELVAESETYYENDKIYCKRCHEEMEG